MSQVECFKMSEFETFNEFYARFRDIANTCLDLGETIGKPNLVHKLLTFFIVAFKMKVIVVDDSKNINDHVGSI